MSDRKTLPGYRLALFATALAVVVVLLGVFGGILAFGFMGLFLGPTLLAVAYSLLSDWVADKAPPAEMVVDKPLPGEEPRG